MNSLLSTFIYLLIFLALTLVTYYPIGFLLISKTREKLADHEIVVFSFLISIIFFVSISFLLSFLRLRVIMLPVLLTIFIISLAKYKKKFFLPLSFLIKDKFLLLLIIGGILVQGFINFPSGYLYKEGLLFWSSQGHDGLWHVALMEEAKKTMPMANPLISGEPLYNYHYLFDVVMGEFGRIFPFFSTLDLYFRFFPVLLSILISLSVYAFVSRWQNNKITAYLATAFTWGIGSFGYVVKYLHEGTIWGGETAFWASQGNTILGNPPHASAFALLPAIFLSLILLLKNRNTYWFVVTFLLTFMLSGFKVSAGVTVLSGLGVVAFLELVRKKNILIVVLLIILGISNFMTINLLTRDVGGFLLFEPWWFIRTMAVVEERLGWVDIELRRQHYASLGSIKGYLRLIQVELTLFIIFVFGNLGMRVVGLFEFLSLLRKKAALLGRYIDMALITGGTTALIMVLLFVQKGIIYNHIQYFQYFALIMGWYAAVVVTKFLDKFQSTSGKAVVLVAFFIFSMPTVVGNLVEFYGPGKKPLSIVNNQLLEGLIFLKGNSDSESVVLTVPFEDYRGNYQSPPKPIYNWYSTAYIPALAARTTYLSSEEQLDITGYKWRSRRESGLKFFSNDQPEWGRQFLSEEGIDFVFIAEDELKEDFDWESVGLSEWFVNDSVKIYWVL